MKIAKEVAKFFVEQVQQSSKRKFSNNNISAATSLNIIAIATSSKKQHLSNNMSEHRSNSNII
jgi:hypothetical protein